LNLLLLHDIGLNVMDLGTFKLIYVCGMGD